ncbi:MAG TPA: hypothetical protein PLC98_11560 [Anaerolineales bacterium]|nr:hypothetical protein [Anaerolineales bacterium]
MNDLIPERNKRTGVCYALTDDGLELPVVDITHPAFAVNFEAIDLDELIDSFVASLERSARTPAEMMRAVAAKSILIRGMLESADTYTTGLVTYLHKLGPENLGEGYATPIDRQWATGLTPLTFRWRMRDIAHLLSDHLSPLLEARPGVPLDLINIGGGPAADSFNALLVMAGRSRQALAGRRIRIHVLDIDPHGPAFGARAVEALRADGAPLAGLDVALEARRYDWIDRAPLQALLEALRSDPGLLAVSSEGALFEYASDYDIVANLITLRDGAPVDTVVVGPVVRDAATLDPRLRASEHVAGRPAIRYLGLACLTRLAEQAGWSVAETRDGPMHQVFRLAR